MDAKITSAGDSKPERITARLGFVPRPFSAFAKRHAMYIVSAQRQFATMIAATVCQNAMLLKGGSHAA